MKDVYQGLQGFPRIRFEILLITERRQIEIISINGNR